MLTPDLTLAPFRAFMDMCQQKFESAAASLVRLPVRTIRRHDQRSSNRFRFGSPPHVGSAVVCMDPTHNEKVQSGRVEPRRAQPLSNQGGLLEISSSPLHFHYSFTT